MSRTTRWHVRAALLTLALAGCRDIAPTATSNVPLTNEPRFPSLTLSNACGRTCSLTDDGQPFDWAKNTPTDTAGASLTVARVRVAGTTGDAVALAMVDTARAANSTSSTTGLVVVRVNAAERRYSLAELGRGVTIHEFAAPD